MVPHTNASSVFSPHWKPVAKCGTESAHFLNTNRLRYDFSKLSVTGHFFDEKAQMSILPVRYVFPSVFQCADNKGKAVITACQG